jgi:hypothetical protein
MAVWRKGGKAVRKSGRRQRADPIDGLERPGKRHREPYDKAKAIPPYRPTALPPKHPQHTPTPNRRGR